MDDAFNLPAALERLANEAIPWTPFQGTLRQLQVTALSDVFDHFFPRFRTEVGLSSFVTRGRGRAFYGDLAMAGDSAVFVGRGRERRFAGDANLQRQRYHCLQDAPTNSPENNTLLCELFAYADPRFPLLPELLDTTVDTDRAARLCASMGWEVTQPAVLQIVRPRDEPWLLSPAIGVPSGGCFLRYPITQTDVSIANVIDLRLPDTLDWLMRLGITMERGFEGKFIAPDGENIVCMKGDPPPTADVFLRTLLAQSLGGGSTFIQGIGALLRSLGTEALIFPSARADSRSVVRNGRVEESFGHILVDYRDAPATEFDPSRYFGALPTWRERLTKRLTITHGRTGTVDRMEATGVRLQQQYRYAIFHDWTTQTLMRTRHDLRAGATTLGAQVRLSLRRPSDIAGPGSEPLLGTDTDFKLEEGGPATGFLVDWINGPYRSVAGFLVNVLPAAQSALWSAQWDWDGVNWFLYRRCLVRPWAILKCPVCLSEFFWDTAQGRPMRACSHCGFAQASAEAEVDAVLAAYAAPPSSEMQASAPDDDTVYKAICEGHLSATAVSPPSGSTGQSRA